MATIDITPPNRIYGTFSRLNYKPWFAIAEFVDNSTQNFFDHAEEIAAADGQTVLEIAINYSPSTNELKIRDDANGMSLDELTRALKISSPPPDTSGRSEFGMGLKTAACWFGPVWTITTKRLGNPHEYSIEFDVEKIGHSSKNDIEVVEKQANRETHFTEIRIKGVFSPMVGLQIKKVKDTLRSMYRVDLSRGTVEIGWNGELLHYEQPQLFERVRENGESVLMHQDLDFEVVDPSSNVLHRVTGWVGVLNKMSSTINGFALLRRGRLVIGGPKEGWRPSEVVGQLGSPEWKRLVGELNVDSFPVNFTKDGFHWEGGLEDAMISKLAPLCSGYRTFARDLRTRPTGFAVAPKDFIPAMDAVQTGVQEPAFKSDAARLLVPPIEGLRHDDSGVGDAERVPFELEIPLPGGTVRAILYLEEKDRTSPWMKITSVSNSDLDIVLNTQHPFVESCTTDERGTTILGQMVLALAIAEQQGRLTHGDMVPADEVRTWMNTILLRSKLI